MVDLPLHKSRTGQNWSHGSREGGDRSHIQDQHKPSGSHHSQCVASFSPMSLLEPGTTWKMRRNSRKKTTWERLGFGFWGKHQTQKSLLLQVGIHDAHE